MNIFKKPYEISLWDDRLVWHRRKLDQVNKETEFTQENPYKRGKYYVEKSSADTLGTAVYELSYEDYDENETYYKLSELTKGNYLEGNSAKDIEISITPPSGWYDNDIMVPQIVTSFYKEVRLCTIGAHNMESLARCVNPKLVSKVNGENTLTFTMYYQYIDPETGEKVYNPFIGYLQNERKVKLRAGEGEDAKWYDFVIKQIQENSESRAFTYTCKDQHINELSKSGFEIELDNELENNMGTVDQLAETILEGSDWQLEGESNLKQFIEEPLYEVWVKQSKLYFAGVEILNPTGDFSRPPDRSDLYDKKIYVFYSDIVNKREDIQFLYVPPGVNVSFEVNDDLVIDKDKYPNYVLKNVTYGTAQDSNIDANGMEWPDFVRLQEKYKPIISPSYRGMRLIRQIRTKYDSKIDKYVQEYTKQGDTSGTVYYGFEETKYLSPNAVNNYIVNPNAFTSTSGWYVQPNAKGAKATLELVFDPPFSQYQKFEPTNEDLIFCYELQDDKYVKTTDEKVNEDKDYYRLSLNSNFTSYLKFPSNGGALVNSSINSHKSSLKGFEAGKDRYVLRLKYKTSPSGKLSTVAPSLIRICRYKDMEDFEIVDEGSGEGILFKFLQITGDSLNNLTTNKKGESGYLNIAEDGYLCFEATCSHSLSAADLKNWDKYYGLFLSFREGDIYIEDVQLFPYIIDNDGRLCVPGGELFAKVETTKKYYDPQKVYSSLEEIEFEPEGTYLPKYADGAEAFTKVSSISAKESNRFNLLQELNEKFECWSRFRIERNKTTGEILYGKDLNPPVLTGDEAYRQQKFISFHEYVGEPNYVGFSYGVNSKSIQRTIDSNAIVSKMIVKNNANEFAPNGFCSIARATENPTGENFVLNFDHYIRHNLLDLDIVTNDLYVDANGYFGYYKKLKDINRDRDALVNEQSDLLKEIANYEASYQTYKTSHDSAVEEQNQIEDNIFLLIVPKEAREKDKSEGGAKGLGFAEIIDKYSRGWEDNSSYIKYTTSWMQCNNVIKQHGPLYQKADEYLNGKKDENGNVVKQGVKGRHEEITAQLKEKAEQKRALNLQFYKKYSRFIQEGSWIKEDYVDDNLYYLDSLSTLHTSSQPKVTYNISVIDLSPLSEYEAYAFKLGDKTYIEDVEFFGWSLADRARPYREEIVVSEITQELDAPEKKSIKVQNYKTQFEDLFQRITAQTQQAEYHTGEYKRAANIVEPGGTISVSTLENSFTNNSLKLSNVRDQSVVIDEYGITSTSLANPSEMVRIVNGGIFMSTDGGQSWRTGLTGYGLNSSYLTAGQINTDEIYIMNGNNAAFRWDSIGLSAYALQDNGTYNQNKYVRFDQFGIYGVQNKEDWVPTSAGEVHNEARFALTWDGFSLKNNYGNGSVGISSTNDFYIKEGIVDRIKIGRLEQKERYVEWDGTEFEEGVHYYIFDDTNKEYQETQHNSPVENVIYYTKENVNIYGIRIKDKNDKIVMETDDEGKLWLKDSLSISDVVTINNPSGPDGEVFNANDNFIVYNNGRLKATQADIEGTLRATDGSIGGLQIDGKSLIAEEEFVIKIGSEPVLKIEENNLYIKGKLDAQGGTIGGFLIQKNELVSTETREASQDPSLKLDGGSGHIIANKITIGTNAEIKDFIKLGQTAYLRNPTQNEDGLFIETANTKIYETGKIQVGDIEINGENSKISGTNFSITPQEARFSNVYVSGEIETVVFKKNSVQAAGGAMIFRPSYKLQSNQGKVYLELEQEQSEPTLIDHTVWIIDGNGQNHQGRIISQSLQDGLEIEFSDVQPESYMSLIDLGRAQDYYLTEDLTPIVGKTYYIKDGTQGADSWYEIKYDLDDTPVLDDNGLLSGEIPENYELNNGFYGWNLKDKYEWVEQEAIIGINSGNTAVGEGLVYPNGLTITELGARQPNLFLGNLSSLGGDYSGHGLYADNVYLNGSLTTRAINTNTYAGVNTLSGVKGKEDIVGSESNIIFWAGAKENEEEAIRNAPFQVTEDGHVYVKNSIFAGGKITGAEIHTARIYGNALDDPDTDKIEPALTICDDEKGRGISFVSQSNPSKEIFSISNGGLKINNKEFISINEDQVIFKTLGDTNYIAMGTLAFDNKEIPSIYHYHSNNSQCGLFFEEGVTSFKFFNGNEVQNILEMSSGTFAIKQQLELSYNNADQKMQYKAVEGGYDLYIVASS